jgi:hypothetical protein
VLLLRNLVGRLLVRLLLDSLRAGYDDGLHDDRR